MPSLNYGISLGSISRSITRTGESKIEAEITLPVATAGTLTTRTDDNTGVITVTSHSITTSDTVDVYWSTGRRYGVDVTAQDSTTISIDLGAGDNLPSTSTAVKIVKQVPFNLALDGDNAKIVGFSYELAADTSDGFGCRVTLFDSADDTITGLDLDAFVPNVCDIEGGATNLYTGDPITDGVASNGSSAYAATLKIQAIVDATP
jgi:hypothetical protein